MAVHDRRCRHCDCYAIRRGKGHWITIHAVRACSYLSAVLALLRAIKRISGCRERLRTVVVARLQERETHETRARRFRR